MPWTALGRVGSGRVGSDQLGWLGLTVTFAISMFIIYRFRPICCMFINWNSEQTPETNSLSESRRYKTYILMSSPNCVPDVLHRPTGSWVGFDPFDIGLVRVESGNVDAVQSISELRMAKVGVYAKCGQKTHFRRTQSACQQKKQSILPIFAVTSCDCDIIASSNHAVSVTTLRAVQ